MDQSLKSIPTFDLNAEEARLPLRRAIVVALNLASMAALAWAMSRVLGDHGWKPPEIAFMAIYLIG
ncbi:MAG: hypothetical protein ACXWK0_01550, partial [Caulobacteraceae bacterium]